jgi:hypothetical protein
MVEAVMGQLHSRELYVRFTDVMTLQIANLAQISDIGFNIEKELRIGFYDTARTSKIPFRASYPLPTSPRISLVFHYLVDLNKSWTPTHAVGGERKSSGWSANERL